MELDTQKSELESFIKQDSENDVLYLPNSNNKLEKNNEISNWNSDSDNKYNTLNRMFDAIDISFIDESEHSENNLELRIDVNDGKTLYDNINNNTSQEGRDEPDLMLDPRTLTTPIPTEIDINVYQQKKTIAQGMMDLALLLANANQLRYVLESIHPYFLTNIILLGISITLQIVVGIGLILNSQYSVKNEKEMSRANRINNYTVIGIFLVTIANVFIAAFGIADTSS